MRCRCGRTDRDWDLDSTGLAACQQVSLHDWDQLPSRDGLWVAGCANRRGLSDQQAQWPIVSTQAGNILRADARRSANLVEDDAFDEMGQSVCAKNVPSRGLANR